MFFILSKLLAFLLRPIVWVFFLLLGSLWVKTGKRRKRLLWTGLIVLYLFSNSFLFNLFVRWWEQPSSVETRFSSSGNYELAIVLGGYSELSALGNQELHHLSGSGNRFHQALQLFERGVFKSWLLSGGSGRLLSNEKKEAPLVRELLLQLGVEPSNIIVEEKSRNTHENALFSKRIVQDQFPDAQVLLITSAWHMPRAKACFEKEGIDVVPFCTDYKSKKVVFRPEKLLLPDAGALKDWELLIKEWVGYLVYRIKGYL